MTDLMKQLLHSRKTPLISQKKFMREFNKIVNDRNKDQYQKKVTFAPSSIGYGSGKCPRRWRYAFNGAVFKNDILVKSRMMMDAGISSHERLQEIIKDMSFYKDHEVEIVSESPPVRGFADLLLEEDGKIIVGEIKTVGSSAFNNYSSGKFAADYHILQVLIYMHILDAEQGFILYENRDDYSIYIYHVFMEDYRKELDEIIAWMDKIHGSDLKGSDVKRPYKQSSYECRYCPLFEQCWNDPEGTTKIGVLPYGEKK